MAKKKSTRKTAAAKPAKPAAKPTKPATKPAANPAATPPASPAGKLTLAHVTHEATEQLGGIGAVLEGLITSPVYQDAVGRSILIGPTATLQAVDPQHRLGDHGEVLYSSVDEIDTLGLGAKLRPIEWAFETAIVYGRRSYAPPGTDRTGEAEVLLIDCFRHNPDRLNRFKFRLFETFGLDSAKYESSWDYEEYVRLAEPAFYALRALLNDDDLPCVLFAHEFMGMPAALQAILDGGSEFRTVFHGHECSTARSIVEHHPGHDTMFYNALKQARDSGLYVDDVFGDQSHQLRHALIGRAHLCDGVIAVGDYTAEEMRLLNAPTAEREIDVVYNGVPAFEVDLEGKRAARSMLQDYAAQLLPFRPDVLCTHVTRPVISKAMWRDVQVCHELADRLAASSETGVLFILTTAGGTRRPQDVMNMEKHYGWPRRHREGYPDLVGPEVDLNQMIEPFNAQHENFQIVLVNQFGWTPQRIGKRLPKAMDMGQLRFAADVEFGMACYEPFGISPLEPLGSGAVCAITNVCGCRGFADHAIAAAGGGEADNVLVADFTRLDRPLSLDRVKAMTQADRDRIERIEAKRVAEELDRRLPRSDNARRALLERGQALVEKMGWDPVCETMLLPMLRRICRAPGENGG